MCKPQDQRGQPHLGHSWVERKSRDTWVAEKQGWHLWESLEIPQWHCCNCLRPSGCSNSRSFSFDLFYLTAFLGLSLSPKRAACRSSAWWPGTPQHLSIGRGVLSNDRYPDLAEPQVLFSSAATILGTDILNHHTKMCQSLVWLRYNTQSLFRGHWCNYMWMCRGRGETAFHQKSEDISSELPLKCDYIFKAIYGIRRLYILPVLIPRGIIFNKEIKRILC